ncbi:MAG: hypothetical protein EB027_05330, partial [Actinobacteria bacterium]|nr:hypothetical protein [Actinomycetota bacterium]
MGAQVSEVTTGAAAQNNVTLSAQTQNTRLSLNLASAQAGTLRFGYEGTTRTVALTSAQTDAALISAVDTALEGFAGVGANTVTVTGTRAAGFTIDIAGARAGQDISGITLSFEPQVATASVSLTQQGEIKQTGTSTTGTNASERQAIKFSGATTNTGVRYTLGKPGGGATAQLDFSRSSPPQNRAVLQSALDQLYGAGQVKVTFDRNVATSTTAEPRYFIDFVGTMSYQDIGQLEVRSQTGVAVAVSTIQQGSAVTKTPTTQTVSAIQKVTLANTQAGGTFALSFKVGSNTYTTAALSMTATAAQVQAALSALNVTGLTSAAGYTVTAITGGYQVTFGGGLAGQAIAPMTVKVTPPASSAELFIVQKGLTRSVSQTVTTPGINETQAIEIDDGGVTGSFTLSLAHSGTTYTTAAIKFGATGTEVQQALLKAFADGGLSGTQITVSQKGSGRYEVSFGGVLGAANLSLMKASAQADSPNAQLTVVQAGASVAQPALQASVEPNLVVDFGVRSLEVKTGPSTSRTLTLDGSVGAQIKASGQMTLELFGFVRVSGGVSFEKSTGTVKTASGATVSVDQLTVGVGAVEAFVGVNGGTASAVGLQVNELDFGLAMYTERLAQGSTATPRKWTAMKGAAGAVSLTGVSDVTLTGSSLALAINRAAADGSVLDFAGANSRTLSTGPGTEIALDLAGSDGALLEASGNLKLDLFA